MRKLILALGALLVAAAAPPATDWSKTVEKSADGTFVVGNPKAAKTLVEYASYTCGHCAHFSVDSTPELEREIAAGKVRFELRHALRDRVDLTAALLARCAGPARFFAASKAIFADQEAWMAKAELFENANGDAVTAAGPAKGGMMLARGSGLLALVAPYGVTEDKAATCLADEGELDQLVRQTEDAWKTKAIPGTPYFVLNGAPLPVNGWADLRAELAKP